MSKVEFKRERLDECLEEMKPLLLKHWQEVSLYRDKIPYAPDWDKYKAMEDADILHILVGRKEGEMVAYHVNVVSPGLHYMYTKYAVNDALYVKPDMRGSTVSYRMFKFAEEYFKAIGVDVMTVHMKTKAPFDRLCEKLGYDYGERMYFKYIGD